MHHLPPGYFNSTQPAGAVESDPLGAGLHGTEDGLFHGSAVGDSSLHLLGYSSGYQIGIQFRLPDLLDVKLDSFADKVLKVVPGFVNALSAPSDYNAGARSIYVHCHFVCLALDFNQ